MSNKKISDHPDFARVLEHAVYIADEIINSVGTEEEDLANASVTVSAEFLLDFTDMLIEFAAIYEDFDPSEHLALLELCRNHQTDRFTGKMTKH